MQKLHHFSCKSNKLNGTDSQGYQVMQSLELHICSFAFILLVNWLFFIVCITLYAVNLQNETFLTLIIIYWHDFSKNYWHQEFLTHGPYHSFLLTNVCTSMQKLHLFHANSTNWMEQILRVIRWCKAQTYIFALYIQRTRMTRTFSLFIHNTPIARYFLPPIFWVLVIQITNKHHVSVGCKIVGNGEESG